jgi:peptidoglycan/xylan/chitin deacetylase (PgdA/CDA1 family)
MNEIALTFDVDFAEDTVIDETVKLLKESNTKSTWFVTHDSPAIQRLKEDPLIDRKSVG